MRAKIITSLLKALTVFLLFGLIACEGDPGAPGAQGPAGPTGPQGPQGVAGQDGQNGAENCVDCHGNNQLITAKMFQWQNSVHAIGGHYERNDAACAACHTSQGFLDRIETGAMEASMDTEDPLPQNCYTCHKIHTTYTEADWALTADEPVTLWVGGTTHDIGKGNLCLNCHQARLRSPAIPEVTSTDSVTITSAFWGPHHGSQGALFTGSSTYEIGEGYENSLHSSLAEDGCIKCHMAPVIDGRGAGGHTFRVETAEGELNPNGCVQCHSDADALEMLVTNTQNTFNTLLDSLENKLVAQGVLGITFGSLRAVPGTHSAPQAGALWNYLYLAEDKSGGVHNFKYAKTLIENSIAALD